jgi:AraC-like DNA-binding protein
MLLAVDDDQRVVDADRHARTWLLRQHKRIEDGVGLWSAFEPALMLFRHRNRGDVAAMLMPIGASEPWAALVTPPMGASAGWGPSELARCHSRPRIDLIRDDRQFARPVPARGGLPTRTLRRVKDYIEENLDKNLQVATLADAAGYSAFHFARAFKESEGMTPHDYLIQRRIERAQALLTKTELSVSEVARASGFSDQSHLARHFRQQLGLSPSTLRRQKK